jgi:hypothetical protein
MRTHVQQYLILLLYMCPHTTQYQASAYLFSFAGAQLETAVSRYSAYLLYWYKSTNTDAGWQPGGEEPVDRQRLSRLSEHVPRRHSGTPDGCSACQYLIYY